MNPYNWQVHRPVVEVLRSNVKAVAADLQRGGSCVLLAGRGMGKSVFLRQLHAELEGQANVRPFLFSAPPAELTVRGCLQALARKLDVDAGDALDTHEIIDRYLRQHDNGEHVVLLYDEFDRYAHSRASAGDLPGKDFFNNLESTRRDFPRLGILAAGSIGVFLFRDVLGSSFLARAEPVRLTPFDPPEIRELALPFADEGRPLPQEILEAIHLASGGNPALVTYGLESLWDVVAPTPRDAAEVYTAFRLRHSEFLRDFRDSFSSPELSQAPQRIWSLIQSADGPISHADLRAAAASPAASADDVLKLDYADVLDLLQAAGLVRINGPLQVDPVNVRPVAGILSLPNASPPVTSLESRLIQDLETLLARLHASSADFYRPGRDGGSKQLVPEAVFAAFLALGFELLGWQAEREAQHGAGRTDLKLRWQETKKLVVIEVKIWGRGDYENVQQQIEGYWSANVTSGAVVMITDSEIPDWPAVYRQRCLDPLNLESASQPETSPPISARFSCTSQTRDGLRAHVDHFLLRIPRGH